MSQTPVYHPVDFSKWLVLSTISRDLTRRIELLHVFGEKGDAALLVDDCDVVYGVGSNDFGRLGIGDTPDVAKHPIEVTFPREVAIMCFATGPVHVLALSQNGALYSWGCNAMGQLGNGTNISTSEPRLVLFLKPTVVKAIAASGAFSMALTEDHKVFLWGDMNFDCFSIQNIPYSFCPELTFDSLACSASLAAVITQDGKVFLWGALQQNNFVQRENPFLPNQNSDEKIVSVVCVSRFIALLDENGTVYCFGENDGAPYFNSPVREMAVASSSMSSPIVFRTDDDFVIFRKSESQTSRVTRIKNNGEILNIQSIFENQATPQVLRATPDNLAKDACVKRKIVCSPRDIATTLFNVKDLSDLTIKLADGNVYVHKLILIAFCEHFKSMLIGAWADQSNKQDEIDMTQYNPVAYRAFLKYIYSGFLEPLNGNELIDLYDISQSYFEATLQDACVKMFHKSIDANNVCALFERAHCQEFNELSELCFEAASQNLDELVLSEGYDNLPDELCKVLVKEAIARKVTSGKK